MARIKLHKHNLGVQWRLGYIKIHPKKYKTSAIPFTYTRP